MAKAFTENERIEITEKIMETALDLFHEGGSKSLSIKELTSRVGIAQGSFYNFWKDKETLIIDLICYRSSQKLKALEKNFHESLKDPIQFLTDVIYEQSIDLMKKIESKEIYKDAFKIFYKKNTENVHSIRGLYTDFLKNLITYWKDNNVINTADEEGLSTAFIGSFILCIHTKQFDESYFNEVLRIYIVNIVKRYIKF